ncbi:hypothetical protein P43SY_007933 [Pythium insidiosum]|uniref:Uncharacterized protein n=1 Tax=Pythium insidiosum TaxID=114742 RepID=A0AAD5LP88_PYTIN|nr:hypothetical protein P43SY_007933 [Pythium insidiosum]
MIVWVKYGFGARSSSLDARLFRCSTWMDDVLDVTPENAPRKMYNTNVSCAVLLSFLKASCIKDVDDFCKQKSVQLAIELDAIRRTLVQRKSVSSVAPAASTPAASRPTSGAQSARPAATGEEQPPEMASPPATPGSTRRGSKAGLDDVAEQTQAKKALFERQLDAVNAASMVIKELMAGIAWLDLVDENGSRMNIDSAGNDRANTILSPRQQYEVVAVARQDDGGQERVTPLVFKLNS